MKGLWCKKVGMTQVFDAQGVVVPVTALEVGEWVVTQLKTEGRDGYAAVQIGLVRDRYVAAPFSGEWLRKKAVYFSLLRELPVQAAEGLSVGMRVDPKAVITQGDHVHVTGKTIGRGFQGGVKRHGFAGGPASHGGTLGRRPGSMGFMRSRGRVIKGWRMAGHMGTQQRVVQNLRVVGTEADGRLLLVQGSVPGKAGSFVVIHKV